MAVAQQEIEQATALAQQGNSEAAVALLSQLIQREASNAAAWLALSEVVDDPERAEFCLQKVLQIDPENAAAQEQLSKSKGGSLSVGSVGGFNQSDSGDAAQENLAEPSFAEAEAPDATRDSQAQLEAVTAAPAEAPEAARESEALLEAAAAAPAEAPEATRDSEALLEAAAAAPVEAAQAPKGLSSIGRTDQILIGLTVLAGVVLCALVSAALI